MPTEVQNCRLGGDWRIHVSAQHVNQGDPDITTDLEWQMPPSGQPDYWTDGTWTVTQDPNQGYVISYAGNVSASPGVMGAVRCYPFKAVILGYVINGASYDITITAVAEE